MKKLTQKQAEDLVSGTGYLLAGQYIGRKYRVLVRCEKHNFEKEVLIGNLLAGSKMVCCHDACGAQRNTTLTTKEVCDRLLGTGYALVGKYLGLQKDSLLRCEKHGVEHRVRLANIFQGGKMQCCGKESMAAKLSIRLTGSGNHFFGKTHSLETREKLSRLRKENPSSYVPTPAARAAISERQRGKPRSAATKEKLRTCMRERYSLFGYSVRMAASGKTAGKPGIFYVVRIGDLLKLGSATTTMNYRLSKLRSKHGCVELVTYCLVDDAGAYEAAAMERCRQHWSHGEYFHDWLRATLA